jgi:hypothetical protein
MKIGRVEEADGLGKEKPIYIDRFSGNVSKQKFKSQNCQKFDKFWFMVLFGQV